MGRFHLTWVGPAAYAEDLVRSRQRICGTYRTGILVLHGLPLPLDGCSDPNIANDLQAVTDWLSMAKDQSERDISTTRLLWRSRIIANCSVRPNECTSGVQPPATPNSSEGPVGCPPPAQPPHSNVQPQATFFSSAVWPPASAVETSPSGSPPASLYCPPPAQGLGPMLRLRLPASLDSLKPTIVIMEWIPNLCMKTLDEPLERDIMESLISELNSKFNSGLDPNFSTSRDCPGGLPPLRGQRGHHCHREQSPDPDCTVHEEIRRHH